eukprot:TRINITY_DN55919_c0_g1_i1.p2 TRINITY_DN55919_c0_g1~~TRINITY_DN55919_c0_g1_i1.p2  ORF type:complete len:327 (-),score=69.84 TRINITY_DN55919_c0_g1_i1:84-1064(-)
MAWRCALCSKGNGLFDVVCQTCGRPKGYQPAGAPLRSSRSATVGSATTGAEDEELCCVCFEATQARTECGHAVCSACWQRLEDKTRCPLCRVASFLGPAATAAAAREAAEATARAADDSGGCGEQSPRHPELEPPPPLEAPTAAVGAGGRRVFEELRQLSGRPGLRLATFVSPAARCAATLDRLHRMRLVTQDERQMFHGELRETVRSLLARVDSLAGASEAELLLRPLREQNLVGDAELLVLRRRAARLLPFRRALLQQPSSTSSTATDQGTVVPSSIGGRARQRDSSTNGCGARPARRSQLADRARFPEDARRAYAEANRGAST